MTPPTPSDYSDDRLVAFLRRNLAGERLLADAATHFHDVDIYAVDPVILTSVHEPAPAKKGDGDSWFFFTHVNPKSSRDTRRSRQVAGGVGTWHSERASRAVFDDEGNCIGHFQYFSYKIKTGKNFGERTQWYMVEFSDDDKEGNHDRIHGGEPVLVLCKIYKAHSSSRSSAARKRKPTDALLNQVSSPVKAKRRLFDSTASISSAAASQEPVSSKAWYELAARLKSLHSGIESRPSQDQAESEASQEQVRSYHLSSRLESLCSGLVPKPSQDEEAKPEEPGASQEKLSSRTSYNLQLQGKSNATLDSAFRSELDPSQDKVSESIIQRFWTEATEKQEASQAKLLRDKSNATLDSVFKSELEPLQDKVSESIIQRFWTSETEASQVDKSTMNCSFLMAGGALPMRTHCAPEVAVSSASGIGNDITVSCSSELGCVVGAPTYNELGGIAGGGFTGNLDVRSMPFGPVPLAVAASWLFSGPDIWGC